jgi:hypothetical protein
MIVFLAGMQRSGSTFSFNVVRELLAQRGTIYQEPFPSAVSVVERSGNACHVLFKAHSADEFTLRLIELGAVKAVCTVRRPEDAIASWMETFGFQFNEAVAHMQEWLSMYARLRKHALVVPYEQIDRQPWRAALRIARHICPDARIMEVIRIARTHSKRNVKDMTDRLVNGMDNIQDISFSYYDTKTFFHRRHVSTLVSRPAADRIGKDAVLSIRRTLHAYIDEKNGNLL